MTIVLGFLAGSIVGGTIVYLFKTQISNDVTIGEAYVEKEVTTLEAKV